jgi:hypothetical protein
MSQKHGLQASICFHIWAFGTEFGLPSSAAFNSQPQPKLVFPDRRDLAIPNTHSCRAPHYTCRHPHTPAGTRIHLQAPAYTCRHPHTPAERPAHACEHRERAPNAAFGSLDQVPLPGKAESGWRPLRQNRWRPAKFSGEIILRNPVRPEPAPARPRRAATIVRKYCRGSREATVLNEGTVATVLNEGTYGPHGQAQRQ